MPEKEIKVQGKKTYLKGKDVIAIIDLQSIAPTRREPQQTILIPAIPRGILNTKITHFFLDMGCSAGVLVFSEIVNNELIRTKSISTAQNKFEGPIPPLTKSQV